MRERVQKIVDEVIRPLVAADGGRVEVGRVTDDEVVVTLADACIGCPGIHYTRTRVIVPALRTAVGPSVRIEVRAALPGRPTT